MWTRRIKIWSTVIGTVAVAVCILGIAEVHKRYFFNPLTFRNNDVLYLPWKWYTRPLNMQIYTLTEPGKLVTVTDQSEIRNVIDELDQGTMTRDTLLVQMSKPKRPSYGIMIRTHNNTVLQTIILFSNDKVAQIATQQGNVTGNELISLKPTLLQYVQEELGQK